MPMIGQQDIFSNLLKGHGAASAPFYGIICSVAPNPVIYSPASSIDDRSRVWVGRLPDHDNETVISSQTPPSCGAPAWFVAARESARAEQVPDIIGTDGCNGCIVWARSCQGSLEASAHQARWMR